MSASLPPLPEPAYPAARLGLAPGELAYTPSEMRTYAAAAVAADRAHIRALVEAVRDANAAASGHAVRLLTPAQESAWQDLMNAVGEKR